MLGRGKSRRLSLWSCHYFRGSWTAPASHSLSSHKHTFIYLPSFPPPPWRAQEKSCPLFPSTQSSDPSPWSRCPYPTLTDKSKTRCQVSPQDLARAAVTLASTGGSSPTPGAIPLGVGYLLPVTSQSCLGPSLGRMAVCHAPGTGQLLFFIMMKKICMPHQ